VTDRPDSPDASGSPETPEVAEVRRLLAAARHTEPMPEDVVTRMEGVLAGLAAESTALGASSQPDGEPRQPGVVVPIDAHRRRRVAGLLVAAAAIVVGGVTIAPHLPSGSDSRTAGTTAQDAGGETSGNSGSTGNGPSGPEKAPGAAQSLDGLTVVNGHVLVRPRHFSVDARHGRALLQANSFDRAVKAPCPAVPGPGERVAAEYEHAPAVLVYRRPQGSTQVVDLYVCGNDRPVRSTTLPAP
jgi:hypothetical protein